jgi:dTDP-4-dehydrorhamnose 3,5-epimerase-like enzyme
MDYKFIDFDIRGDERGSLIAFEENVNVPFDVKRVFYIFDTKGSVSRGLHANRRTKHLLININGSCRVKVDNGKEKVDILINRPDQGLFINNMVWKEMHEFSYNCILMVLASEYYDETEYIRDYNEYMKIINGNKNGNS